MKQGICTKCGKEGFVQKHHIHGYSEEHKDDVVDYCKSCDQKAHYKARREGRCNLSSHDSRRYSLNSYKRRNTKTIHISDDLLLPGVYLSETIIYNTTTWNPTSNTCFCAYHKQKIMYIGK